MYGCFYNTKLSQAVALAVWVDVCVLREVPLRRSPVIVYVRVSACRRASVCVIA